MDDAELNRRELTGDDALRFARESGMERASETRGLFLCGVGDLIRFARLVRAGWTPPDGVAPCQAPSEDKWAMLARSGHLSQEVADAARDVARGVAGSEHQGKE